LLDWNRVLLYVWPVVDVPLDELDSVVRVLAPGLQLEPCEIDGARLASAMAASTSSGVVGSSRRRLDASA